MIVPEVELCVRLHQAHDGPHRLTDRPCFGGEIVFEPSNQPQSRRVLEDDETKSFGSHARPVRQTRDPGCQRRNCCDAMDLLFW